VVTDIRNIRNNSYKKIVVIVAQTNYCMVGGGGGAGDWEPGMGSSVCVCVT
jgi:hypothetical protein